VRFRGTGGKRQGRRTDGDAGDKTVEKSLVHCISPKENQLVSKGMAVNARYEQWVILTASPPVP
jgi:hypothetical protein